MCIRDRIRKGLAEYGASADGDNTPLFRFGTRPEVAAENRNGTSLTVTFSKSDSEQLTYNESTGLYEKYNPDGSAMTDGSDGRQAAFTNVFVLYASSGIKAVSYTHLDVYKRQIMPLCSFAAVSFRPLFSMVRSKIE